MGSVIRSILEKTTITMNSSVTPWQVLKQRDFGFFWLSLLFSAVGSQISTVAVAWQVYEITDSPFQLGLTGLLRALPVMILSLPGGVIADRMDRRKLLIITQSLAALLALALALLTSTGQIRVWHIYAVTFLSGAVGIFDAPARTAMIPALVSAEQLASAYALNITWRQIATLAGPFIGGIMIGALGVGAAYYIDAVSFLAVIICLGFMRRQVKPARDQKESAAAKRSRWFQFHPRQLGYSGIDEHGRLRAIFWRLSLHDARLCAGYSRRRAGGARRRCSAFPHSARWQDRA